MLNEVAIARLKTLTRGGPNRLPPQKLSSLRRCHECNKISVGRKLKRCKHCGSRLTAAPPRLCRLCDGELPPRRRSWCGEECIDAYFLATSSSYARDKVWERDKGVCAGCGLDCGAIEARVHAIPYGARGAAYEYLRGLGFSVANGYTSRSSLWDCDHVLALAEGGSNYEMSNLQTLCQLCHKKKTAEHAARRGKQRRLLGKKWVEGKRRELGLN